MGDDRMFSLFPPGKRDQIREELGRMRRDGAPWRDAYRRTNLNRYFTKRERQMLKSRYAAPVHPLASRRRNDFTACGLSRTGQLT
jgi:hypothetical protein